MGEGSLQNQYRNFSLPNTSNGISPKLLVGWALTKIVAPWTPDLVLFLENEVIKSSI